ncbi:hypothetical protein [Actinophytocola sp.]|uniref:hypothetical protein n=1 Tax=Actinophytocola sp. TaxID=1872138 RepID=UPI00389A6363
MRQPIELPPLSLLPPSPLRALVETLHGLYQQADKPPLRAIDEWIVAHPEHDGAISRESIRRLLVGINVPRRWESARSVFLALCALAGANPDEHARTFRRQWQEVVADPMAARRPYSTP